MPSNPAPKLNKVLINRAAYRWLQYHMPELDLSRGTVLVAAPLWQKHKARGYVYEVKRWHWNCHMHGKARKHEGEEYAILVQLAKSLTVRRRMYVENVFVVPWDVIGTRTTLAYYNSDPKTRRGAWLDQYIVKMPEKKSTACWSPPKWVP